MVQYLDELNVTLKMRQEDEYLSPQTKAEMDALVDDRFDTGVIFSKCKDFFGNLFNYLQTVSHSISQHLWH